MINRPRRSGVAAASGHGLSRRVRAVWRAAEAANSLVKRLTKTACGAGQTIYGNSVVGTVEFCTRRPDASRLAVCNWATAPTDVGQR